MDARFKSLFSRLTIRRRLTLLTLLFLSGFLCFSVLAHDTLMTTKVNGPYYDRIIQGKDLIADVLPPPEYIIEAHLLVLQMMNTADPAQLSRLMKSFDRLESEYLERHSFWVANLPEGQLKEMMVVQSFEPARRFFVTSRRDLFPLLLNGEHADANAIVKDVLHECYEQHRACIDKVVEMSKARIADDEQAAQRVIADRTTLMVTMGSILALVVALGSEMLGQRIAARLDETVRVLDAVAAGDLSQHLQTRGQDEIAQMGISLNQAIASSRHNLTAVKAAEQKVRELNADLEQRVSQRTLALHESEQRLVAILDNAIDSIITIDGAGLIESVNPAAEQMFGYSLAEMIGQNVKMLIPSPQREAHDGYLAKLLQTGTELLVGLRREVVGQRKDGTIFPADLAISSANRPDRHQFTGIVRDITHRKKVETDLAEAKKMAEAANHAKSAFLATMSHDLRTPLNGILGMNDLLLGTNLTDKQRQFVDASHNSGKLLLQLINNVLDLSKIEAGKLELDLQECSVETLVYDVVEALGPGAKQNGLTLRVHVEPAINVTARCDGSRLRQILVNLIGNAIKFTATGTITVSVTGARREAQPLRVRFAVSDTGIGIPQDRRDRLFRPFTQVDGSTTRKFGGSGLGLAICKQMVELMDGEIGIESQVGVGSTFWFEVPLPELQPPAETAAAGDRISGARVLVVAADEPDRSQILNCLQAWNCLSEAVSEEHEALLSVTRANAANAPFDVMLVALRAEGANRFELIDALTHRQGLPVIAFGSVTDDQDCDHLHQRGLRRWLHIPIRPSVLYDALLATLCEQSHAPESNSETNLVPSPPSMLTGHVLVAEDNRINQMYVVELLKNCGCSYDLVANGDEVLDAMQRGRYDVVLMDCQMPEMDGFTASREIRRREAAQDVPSRVPIIALTANALQGDRERCLENGMDNYLSKPIDAAQLRAMLEPYLSNPSKTPSLPPSAPIDLQSLSSRCLGNISFALSLLDEFGATGHDRVEEVVAQAAHGNLATAAELLHALKGVAAVVGATNLRDESLKLEAVLHAGDLIGALELLPRLREEMRRCQDFIPFIRSQLQPTNQGLRPDDEPTACEPCKSSATS